MDDRDRPISDSIALQPPTVITITVRDGHATVATTGTQHDAVRPSPLVLEEAPTPMRPALVSVLIEALCVLMFISFASVFLLGVLTALKFVFGNTNPLMTFLGR